MEHAALSEPEPQLVNFNTVVPNIFCTRDQFHA